MDLKTYLDNRKESVPEFSVRSRLSFNTIYKIIRGLQPRIDTARKIVKYTKNEITFKDLGYLDKTGNTANACDMGCPACD